MATQIEKNTARVMLERLNKQLDELYNDQESSKLKKEYSRIMKGGGMISPAKARKILHDGKVRGKKITDKQRKFFGAMLADGGPINSKKYKRIKKYWSNEDLETLLKIQDPRKYKASFYGNRKGESISGTEYSMPDKLSDQSLRTVGAYLARALPIKPGFTEYTGGFDEASPEFKRAIKELIQEKQNSLYSKKHVIPEFSGGGQIPTYGGLNDYLNMIGGATVYGNNGLNSPIGISLGDFASSFAPNTDVEGNSSLVPHDDYTSNISNISNTISGQSSPFNISNTISGQSSPIEYSGITGNPMESANPYGDQQVYKAPGITDYSGNLTNGGASDGYGNGNGSGWISGIKNWLGSDKGKNVLGGIGSIANTVAGLSPILWNLYQGRQKAEKLPYSQYRNQRSNKALDIMANRRYDPTQELQAATAANNAFRQSAGNIAQSSGALMSQLGGAQSRLVGARSSALRNASNINQGYRGQYAGMLNQVGEQEANRRLQLRDINDRNAAMRRSFTGAGLSGLQQYALTREQMSNQQMRDKQRYNLANSLSGIYGFDSSGGIQFGKKGTAADARQYVDPSNLLRLLGLIN